MKKMDNKGFSLVELIIVIAIMAILIGVLAPTYMRYVNKTRVSRDVSAIDTAVNSVENCMIEWAMTNNGTVSASVKGVTNGSLTVSSADPSLNALLTSTISSYKMSSTDVSCDLTASLANGKVTWSNTVTAPNGQADDLNTRLAH